MDKPSFVDLLNEDLALEFKSIVQYTRHIATMTGPEYVSTVEELRSHLSQELEHALTLAEQIDFLGGSPVCSVPDVPDSRGDAQAALKLDLELEENQLERYRERVEQAHELGLADVAEVLRPLLTQTQDHVRELQSALGA
ncbi:MAG: ferritin-like domain-containing protein [Actinobacteria bacterium]|nr:ferritin-like domain-containing protein [Actinomycetota bacterium]